MGTAILRRYVLIGAIGQGGVSTVYRAVDSVRGRKLAVKILAPTLAGSQTLRTRGEGLPPSGALSHEDRVASDPDDA